MLAGQLQRDALDLPGLPTIAVILGPLFALAVAAVTARRLASHVATTDPSSRALRLLTGLSAVMLLALLATPASSPRPGSSPA